MALLSFRGISTPSLPAQGEQRRFSYFNIQRGNAIMSGAVNWYRSAADQGDAKAQATLGVLYENGLVNGFVSRICGQRLAPVIFPVRDTEQVR
jgi:TPR repeat protein